MGYIDWSITVPLQMIEFNLIMGAAKAPIGPAGFWKLLVGTVAMLAFGYAGETWAINPWAGFALGLCGWGFILFEVFQQHAYHRQLGLGYLPRRILSRPDQQLSRRSA